MLEREGSKILVTTRTKDALIALGAAERRCILIPALDEDIFLKLFMHYALPSVPIDDCVRRTLEDIGKEIAKKLKGSPLAARTVGGQLRMRININFWTSVRDRDILNETMGALWWSYRHLDEQARRCFIYCCIFPQRRPLQRDELVRLWAAAGFARSTNEGEDAEDVCQKYFDDLVSASFLQMGVLQMMGVRLFIYQTSDSYIVHDLLRDLAEKVAGSDHLRIEDHRKFIWINEEVSPDVRHVYVQTYDAALITENICKLKKLRTLIIDSAIEPVEEKVLEWMFVRLKKLRVLSIDIAGAGGKNFRQKMLSVPASLGQLRHLRFLSFQSEIQNLWTRSIRLVSPGTLGKLYHMQVLHFYGIEKLLLTSCEELCDLINLRHAIFPNGLKLRSIGRLTSLRTVDGFTVRKGQGYQLQELRNLNKLGGILSICGIGNVESKDEALEAQLADKEGLRVLLLNWECDEASAELASGEASEEVAVGETSAEVEAEVLEGLCPPKYLDVLKIENYKGLRYPSWMGGEDNGGPKYLTRLYFSWCKQELAPEFGGFGTHLRELEIAGCSWVSLPGCMEQLTSLHKLFIFDCTHCISSPAGIFGLFQHCHSLFCASPCIKAMPC